jgi:hypothetical protein
MTTLTLIIALRGLLELVLWLMIGRNVLVLLAGRYGADNPVVRMFDFLLRPVRACVVRLMPRLPNCKQDTLTFVMVLLIWLGLGAAKLLVAAA